MSSKPILAAIVEARKELDRVDRELSHLADLQSRRNLIKQFLDAAESVLAPQEAEDAVRELSSVSDVARGVRQDASVALAELQDKLWEAIEFTMKVRKRPMTPAEVVDALEEEKFRISGAHKRETVRSTMSRKEDIFEKIRPGLFVLREWAPELKNSRNSDSVSDE